MMMGCQAPAFGQIGGMSLATLRSPRKRKGHGAERRQEILDAAMVLIAQQGVHAVSTREIAAAVGISQPALYAYFATRDDIMAELCEQAFESLRTRLENVGDLEPGESTVRLMCRAYLAFGLEQPNAYRIAFMIEKPSHDPDHDPAGDRALAAGVATYSVFRRQIERCALAGLTRHVDVDLLTQTGWATLHGLVALMIARPSFPWAERDRLMAAHIDHFVRAIMASPSGSAGK